MNTGAKGDWAAVVVPNLLSMVNAGADQHEALATAMFRPTPFEAGFREILACHAPHNALLSVGDLVDGPLWVAGGAETEVTLEIEHDSQRVLWPFTLRRVRDERAYIGSSGLVLRITDTREMPEGERVHELSWSVAEEGSADRGWQAAYTLRALRRSGDRPVDRCHRANVLAPGVIRLSTYCCRRSSQTPPWR
jgi:hypothetical protein